MVTTLPVAKASSNLFGQFPLKEPSAASLPPSSTGSAAVPVEELNTGLLAEILKRGDAKQVPDQYLVKEEERPTVSFDQWADLPIIDFSEVYTNEAGLAEKIGAACRDWGFFQLVNHGIELENVLSFRDQGLKFFGLPVEVKNKMITDKNFCQYRANHLDKGLGHTNLLWAESLAFKYKPVFNLDELIERVWPEGNSELRNISLNFASAVEKLGDNLLDLFALSLGLPRDTFRKHFDKRRALFIRWNYYPPCPQPSAALGIKDHTDPFVFTVLQQDEVGGLQIKVDGAWVGVRPVEGAVVVNVGDLLQAWTNDIFKSVEHRAVVNKEMTRLSVAAFTNLADVNISMVPPPELVDDNHPPVYRPFTFGEYLKAKYRPVNENERVPIGHGLRVLEKFRLPTSKL
ncbi:unnamed protein product [Calypogeia fissa]